MPPGGWPTAPPDVARFVNGLAPARRQVLSDRAVLAIDIPTPAPQVDTGRWYWLIAPPDIHDESLRWYIDGSRRYPTCHALSVTGCGVAVVDAEGTLVGLAKATPPSWVASSAAAEAWALYLTLQEVAILPTIVTDCLGLLRAAEAGFSAATSPKMANARIWKLISELLDGQASQLHRALIWMPAHTSVDQCVHRQRSDLKMVTAIDWRANQLADALAKEAAVDDPGRRAAAMYIECSKRALLHHAVVLGMATHAANNHEVLREDAAGIMKKVLLRDSTPLPPGVRRSHRTPAGIKRKAAACWDDPPTTTSDDLLPSCLLGTSRVAERASCKRARNAAAKSAEKDILASVISETVQRLARPASSVSADDRMAAMRERIRRRSQA
jgi:hypothetical protein